MDAAVPNLMQKSRWLVAVVWCLSWFELYLEVYRYHHVSRSVLLDPALWFPGADLQARPGGWLQAILVCSVLAPLQFAFLVFWSKLQRSRLGDSAAPRVNASFPFGWAAAVFGLVLSVLGVVNQLIRRSPLNADLTLREGNGGFIIIGMSLLTAGLLSLCLARRKVRRD
jgi:hypothetical protein